MENGKTSHPNPNPVPNPIPNPNHISNLNPNPDSKANPIPNPKPRLLCQTSWWANFAIVPLSLCELTGNFLTPVLSLATFVSFICTFYFNLVQQISVLF